MNTVLVLCINFEVSERCLATKAIHSFFSFTAIEFLSAVTNTNTNTKNSHGFSPFSYMELQTLITTSSNLWGVLQATKTINCFVVLSCAFFCLAAYGLCSTNGMQNPPEYDACESFGESYNLGFPDITVRDSNLGYGSSTTRSSLESVCPDDHSFCFPSTLSGFNHKQKSMGSTSVGDSGTNYNGPSCVGFAQDSKQGSNISWSSDYGLFKLLNGGAVSCSLNARGVNDVPSHQTDGRKDDIFFCARSLLKQKTSHSLSKNLEMSKSSSLDGSSAPNVRIGPTVLDWGQEYLYSPSVAFLTVVNTCNDSILHLYEPFSDDLQFYPCNFSEVSLRPGESALICFVFFPRCLGLSSADLILQTSSGGFIVEAKGYASESPFGIQPLLGLEISPSGRLNKNFKLSNPFDETLYVEEITASISVSLGHNSIETDAICSVNNLQVFDNILYPTIKNLLVVKSSQTGSPLVAIKPHRNWEIGPHSSETLMDIDIKVGLEGKIFGAFCLHLRRYSQDKSDTIVVPIEGELDSHFGDDMNGMFVSATLEGLAACEGGESVITISLRNYGPCVWTFVKAQEVADTELFYIKYMDGLLLFPGTVTQVGIIYCNHMHIDLQDLSSKASNLRDSCKLVILTNDSTIPQIEILCEDILHTCFEHQKHSLVGVEEKSKLIKSGNTEAGYEVRNMQLPPNIKAIEMGDVDELVLRNWMSQGTTDGMSVLEDHEVLFPMIQVGSYVSKWVTLKNPSQHPVTVQLILNSGEIIDECRGPDDLLRPSSSDNLVVDEATTPTKHGFSVPESAVTEAYVHPYDNVTLGPIIFYPSQPCGWSGSALIRNNLSGVEWIPLRGFGGLLSLVLLERSEHVHSINFDLKMPKPLHFSLLYAFFSMKEMMTCSQPSVKELLAKNSGDLPLEVKTIRVSGRECGLDGFKIHACRGFALQPGESTKLLISYQTDFSAAMVHRDLELALATGIFLIPMKASFSYDVQSHCKKSIFWMRVKKWLLGFFLVASVYLMLICYVFPQTVPLGSLDYSCKSDDNSIHTTIKRAGKSPLLPCNQRKSKLSTSGKMNNLFCSVEKDTTSTVQAPCGRYSYGQGEPSEQEISPHLIQASQNHKEDSHLLDSPDERKSPSTAIQSSDTTEALSQPGNLVVKTEKEKSRRRRRKGLGAKLASMSEVSSSHSGNSTPSSPLSPAASSSSRSSWPLSPDVEQPSLEAHRLITRVPAQHPYNHQASASTAKTNVLEPMFPVKLCSSNKVSSPQVPHSVSTSAAIPVKRPSATCPSHNKPSTFSFAPTSTVTVVARAPGSIPEKQKDAVEAPKVGLADEYAYDIWGDHLSWIHLLVPKNVTCMKSIPAEKNFDSFFVEGPLTLMANSQAG
ncbi:hypothetical protein RIF29_33945 [Crotalaria pallida]|uniref:Transmembrane protein 131-like N-terminal domain-containing protein n=1 Tax=Crotalaria pallida TaxID=3830 RepID=A0AAN9EE67_CROPI